MSQVKSPLWSNFFRSSSSIYDEMTKMWLRTPLFQNIKKSEVRKLCQDMHIRDYVEDESIFEEGDDGIGVILLLKGSVNITTKDIILTKLVAGDFFGEVALSSKDKRTANAISGKNTKLVFFLRQDLEDWMEHSPSVAAKFLLNLNKVLARRLREANNRISD